MKYLYSFLILLFAGACNLVLAQGYTLTVSEYAVDGIPGHTTYRVYVDMVYADDFLTSVYGGDLDPMSITTTTGFYNDQFASGYAADGVNPVFYGFAPTLVYDSWLTIGIESTPMGSEVAISAVESTTQPFLGCFNYTSALSGTDITVDDETGGAWYVLNGTPNGLPDENLQVLVLQITTEGELCGTMNFQIFEHGDGQNGDTRLTYTFCGAGTFDPVAAGAGCTDSTACNYDPDAGEDDGSCVYAETYYDCSGVCLVDTDGDGVCDELEIAGCLDEFACNYDADATDDNGTCEYLSCLGCTEVDACNYDPDALYNDGSCEYTSCGTPGCTNGNACNFNPEATYDDGTCEYESCQGCMDSEACNYDATAIYDDGSCDYSCYGCTDMSAANYDPNATQDDGSCVVLTNALDLIGVIDFTVPSGTVDGKALHFVALSDIADLSIFGGGTANNGGGSDGQEYAFPMIAVSAGEDVLLVRNDSAMAAYFGACYDNFEVIIESNTWPDQNGDDAVEIFESGYVIETFGDINVDGTGQSWEYLDSWAFESESGWIYGGVNCTDGTETIYDSSCLYPICTPLVFGCTDMMACNYDANATDSDDSCEYALVGYDCDGNCLADTDGDGICDPFEVGGCTSMMACNYDEMATDDDGSCDFFTADFFSADDNMYMGFPSDSMGCTMGTELYNDVFYNLVDNGMGYSWDVDTDDLNDLILALGATMGQFFYNELSSVNLIFCGNTLNVYNSPGFGTYSVVWNGTSFDLPNLGIYIVPSSTASTGCGDIAACNFDACSINDLSLCEYAEPLYDCDGVCLADADGDGVCDALEVAGCMDTMACNYDSSATDEDGSCEYAEEFYDCEGNCLSDADGDGVCDELELAGCTDMEACNYDAAATDDDGSCEYAEEFYDCDGNCLNDADGDGVCDELEVNGCTDPTAENYNADATEDDGSCYYCDIDATFVTTPELDGEPTGSIDITVSGGTEPYEFEWTGPDNFMSGDEDLTELAAGLYVVTITDANGCEFELTVEVEGAINIMEQTELAFMAYPNPTSNQLFLESSEWRGMVGVTLYDMTGRMVWNELMNTNGGMLVIELTGLAAGAYQLEVISEEVRGTQRIQIQR